VRKAFFGALVGALVLAVAGAAFATAQFKQTAEITYSKHKVNKSTGFHALLTAEDPAAPDQKPKGASKVVVKFPGASMDPKGAGICRTDEATLKAGGCPSDSKVGEGEAEANARPLLSCTPKLDIAAFNYIPPAASSSARSSAKKQKPQLAFLLREQAQTPRCPGQTLVLYGKWSGNGVKSAGVRSSKRRKVNNPKLTVNVPPLVVLGTKVVLTKFELTTDAHKKGKHKFFKTPKTCKGGSFKVKTKITYEDKSSFKDTTKTTCSSPKKH